MGTEGNEHDQRKRKRVPVSCGLESGAKTTRRLHWPWEENSEGSQQGSASRSMAACRVLHPVAMVFVTRDSGQTTLRCRG